MRIINSRITFNAKELEELRKENPTLFELASRFPDIVFTEDCEDFVRVERKRYSLCPYEVFSGPVPLREDYEDIGACCCCDCWSKQCSCTNGRYPCWFRRWNDFEHSMTTGEPMFEGQVIVDAGN